MNSRKTPATVIERDFRTDLQEPAMRDEVIMGELVPIGRALDASPADIDDVHNLKSAYPPEEIADTSPITELALALAGTIVALHNTDRAAYTVAISTALKQIAYGGDLSRFNQDAHGIQAAAMARLEATHGALPNRMAYRQRLATKAERLMTWGKDPYAGRFVRWFSRGPKTVITEPSYWFIMRSTWHCMRVRNGIIQTIARPDIPCDAPPERTMGDDWRVIESLPELRIKESGKRIVKNDIDLMTATLGFRTKGNMLFQQMIHHMIEGGSHSRKVSDDVGDEPSTGKKFVRAVIAWTAALIAIITTCAILINIGG